MIKIFKDVQVVDVLVDIERRDVISELQNYPQPTFLSFFKITNASLKEIGFKRAKDFIVFCMVLKIEDYLELTICDSRDETLEIVRNTDLPFNKDNMEKAVLQL